MQLEGAKAGPSLQLPGPSLLSHEVGTSRQPRWASLQSLEAGPSLQPLVAVARPQRAQAAAAGGSGGNKLGMPSKTLGQSMSSGFIPDSTATSMTRYCTKWGGAGQLGTRAGVQRRGAGMKWGWGPGSGGALGQANVGFRKGGGVVRFASPHVRAKTFFQKNVSVCFGVGKANIKLGNEFSNLLTLESQTLS